MHRSLVLAATALLTCAGAPSLAGDSPAAERCRKDLDSIPAFLLANDTGAPEHLRHHGEATLEGALAEARAKAGTVADDAACLKILNDYLSAWRHGHLAVSPAVGLGADGKPEAAGAGSSDDANPTSHASTPTITWLSAKTVLLTVPTFHPDARKPLEALLTSDAQKLRQTPNWIIDLRRNDGGSDETYQELLAAIMVNARYEVGAEFLSTDANIDNNDRVCGIYAPNDENCMAQISALSDAMRAAERGSYAKPPEMTAALERVEEHRSASEAPARVAVMIDHPCGSSCEQFLLSARQSYNVKLFGRSTYGSLDYSNLRPQDLPSGKRMLWYAISRSARLPHLPVDAAGIPPDVFLPPPEDSKAFDAEVGTLQGLLEK